LSEVDCDAGPDGGKRSKTVGKTECAGGLITLTGWGGKGTQAGGTRATKAFSRT